MYLEHVPKIAAAMRADYPTFERGVMFAILSARVQFSRMPDQCKELERRSDKAGCLWSWKYRAYCELRERGLAMHGAMTCFTDPVDALEHITSLYGLGLVKGAFVCQLMGYDVACLDIRNVKREGLDQRGWEYEKNGRWRKHCERYVAATLGRAQELWDAWCTEVGPDYGMTPEACSQLHLDLILNYSRRLKSLSPAKVQIRNEEVPY